MHVITRKRLLEASDTYRDCATALDAWYRRIKAGEFKTFAELRATFGSMDKVGNLYVFNVGGNKLRVICAIHFNRGKVYLRQVLDHAQYDRDAWKT
jgi:mRNA interferase HigB